MILKRQELNNLKRNICNKDKSLEVILSLYRDISGCSDGGGKTYLNNFTHTNTI